MPKKKKEIVPEREINLDNELDPRWANFIQLYIESGNSYRSALAAGFSESYAVVIRQRYPEKVKKSLAEALESKGITSEKIAARIGWLLDQDDVQAVDKGVGHAAKIGVGGGYAPEKHVNLNVEASDEEKAAGRKALEAIK